MWGTINEALNRGKQKPDFTSSFTINGRELTDSLEIANEFNIFCCKCWYKLFCRRCYMSRYSL